MSFELLSLRQLLFPKEEHYSLVFKLRCITHYVQFYYKFLVLLLWDSSVT